MRELDLQSSAEYWEDILCSEGLGDIDKNEGFGLEATKNSVASTLDINGLSLLGLSLVDDIVNERIIVKKIDGQLVGEIKAEPFIMNNSLKNQHLYFFVSPEFRGTGVAQVLYNRYIELFPNNIPNYEYSTKLSKIKFLCKNGYKILGFYDGNSELINFSGSISQVSEIIGNSNGEVVFYLKRDI